MIPLAVLGDSDSESYRALTERGGSYHRQTLQWTEVLGRMRADQLDLGAWGAWGMPGKLVNLLRWAGLEVDSRAPRKHDYLHNFANSGAVCNELMGGTSHQARQLVRLMDGEPERWRQGVVVVRIGVNDFGKLESLDSLARDPAAADVGRKMVRCADQIGEAVGLIHAAHPQARIVVVGIFDNSHWPRYMDRWRSAQEIRNISDGLDRFDTQLKAMVAADPRLAFFDDRAWFAQRWGGRDASGQPAYRNLVAAPGVVVGNTAGDEPHNAVIGDGHAGLIWNVLWAQSLVDLMAQRFALGVKPISPAEVSAFLEPRLAAAAQNR